VSSVLTGDRLAAGLCDASARLAGVVASADEGTRIPTCPDWSLRQLTTHVGRAHRWAGEMVRRRVTEMMPFREAPDGRLPDDPAARPGWVIAGADQLAEAVRQAGDAKVWSFLGMRPAGFWLRRMTHETTVHTADAELAVGRRPALPADLAADGIAEWLEMVSGEGDGQGPPLAEGVTMHLHATDAELNGAGEWLISRTPAGLAVSTGHARADVAVRGPADVLLFVLMRRLPEDEPGIEVLGDGDVFTRWLGSTPF